MYCNLENYGETLPAEPRPSAPPVADAQKGGRVPSIAHFSDRYASSIVDLRQRVTIKPTPPPSAPPANIGRLETVNPPLPPPGPPTQVPGKLPRAILPPQQTFWGAILDAIVGDGPSKR